jgi:hypothetical protein
MSYDIGQSGYLINNANILSPELINTPTHATAYRPNTNDGNFYLIANASGTMACYQTVDNEKIKAWTLNHTNGEFVDVEGAKEECSVIVRREISTGTTAEGLIDSAYTVNSTFQIFTDCTDNVNGVLSAIPVFSSENDYLMFGCQIEINKIAVDLSTTASVDLELTFEYLTQTGWVSFEPTDGTNGFTQDGNISWDEDSLTAWIQTQPNPYAQSDYEYNNYYYIRIRRTKETVVTTPIVTTLEANVADRLYYEEITFDALTDCESSETADSSGDVSGLSFLAGQRVFVYINGFPAGSYLVASDGVLSLGASAANKSVVVGIDFDIEVIPMPVAFPLQTGWNVYQPKSIKAMYVDFHNSLGITVNGAPLQRLSFEDLLSQSVLETQSGFLKLPPFSGWDPRAEIVISQSYPAPFILRAVSYIVEI